MVDNQDLNLYWLLDFFFGYKMKIVCFLLFVSTTLGNPDTIIGYNFLFDPDPDPDTVRSIKTIPDLMNRLQI